MKLLAFSPVLQAFSVSDPFGKLIFIGIWTLSIFSWFVLIQRSKVLKRASEQSKKFRQAFGMQKHQSLSVQFKGETENNPFYHLYSLMREMTMAILSKNKKYGNAQEDKPVFLSHHDLEMVENHIATAIGKEIGMLEKHLYILPLTTGLAPFMGLLGTAWGILVTFNEIQGGSGAFMSNEAVIGGLAMALGTTVLGLLVAIPALVGNSWIKNQIYTQEREMDNFTSEMLLALEMQYRKVDPS